MQEVGDYSILLMMLFLEEGYLFDLTSGLLMSLGMKSNLYCVDMLVLAVVGIGSQATVFFNSILTVDIYERFDFSGFD